MVVALVATVASLCLFFRTNPPIFSSPLDKIDVPMDAGQDTPDLLETPDSAEPAPEAITISTVLDRTAPVESYLRDAGMAPEEARQSRARNNLRVDIGERSKRFDSIR